MNSEHLLCQEKQFDITVAFIFVWIRYEDYTAWMYSRTVWYTSGPINGSIADIQSPTCQMYTNMDNWLLLRHINNVVRYTMTITCIYPD